MKYDELRRLAEAARTGHWTRGRLCNCEFCTFDAATSPDVLLALLDERERLREVLEAITEECEIIRRQPERKGLWPHPDTVADARRALQDPVEVVP